MIHFATKRTLVSTTLLAGLAAGGPATGGELAVALRDTDVAVSLRYRFETVSRDVTDEADALASTLRSALTLETGAYRNFKLFAEVENVTAIGDERFANRGAGTLDNGVTDRPVVADVALTEFNQAYLEYAAGAGLVRLGRQEIVLGDQRFVGNVGWRQNHQSFEGVRVDYAFSDKVKLTYNYLDAVRRIFGDRLELAGHVGELSLKGKSLSTRIYALSLDWEDFAMLPLSTLTMGVEATGSRGAGDWELLYEIELATQSDIESNPRPVDADYFHGMLGAKGRAATLRLGYEKLFGGPEGAFSTPLATLHKFNGWADLFLATPPDGLVDTYVQADGKRGGVTWLARYHDFQGAHGGGSYGDEIDGQISYQTSWKQTIALTWALYDANDFGVDTDKWMLWTSYTF